MDHIYIITNGNKYCWVEITDQTYKQVKEQYLGICPTAKIESEWKFSRCEDVYQKLIDTFYDQRDENGMYFKCVNKIKAFINSEITAMKK